MTSVAAYEHLEAHWRRLSHIGDAISALHWDQSVMMPPGGAAARADQIATLSVLRHDVMVDPKIEDLLSEAEAGLVGDSWQIANLAEMRRLWAHATAVPGSLVEAMSKAGSHCETMWRDARPNSDFALVLPALRDVLTLTRDIAQAKAEVLNCSEYDALLDTYEPGGQSDRIDGVFSDYAEFLPDFLDDVLCRQDLASAPISPSGPFPVEQQRALCRLMSESVGFDFNAGRLDESLHPFSTGVPEDSRITTRYDDDDYTFALMGVLHETGHAMYERGRPSAWRNQPVGDARGMTMHESQSLIVEMQACRSRAFYDWAAPVQRNAFGGFGAAWDVDNLHRRAIQVERGFIRVDADEVTYPAHIILRYRLERAMLSGDLLLSDLPGAWNDELKSLLNITPPDDRRGCLQDIHWYDGAWGYFPTYTLGAMTAAQFFETATAQDPDILAGLGRGDFAPLMNWLRENVHSQASSKSTDAIIEQATGRPLDDAAFKRHLRARYLP
ncbi:MAG: carboxypeptidase M32 [Alphaproteobacteria bacterium]|nr:carboxypeptidase M32 [Alphaproteobacteria bacterium]